MRVHLVTDCDIRDTEEEGETRGHYGDTCLRVTRDTETRWWKLLSSAQPSLPKYSSLALITTRSWDARLWLAAKTHHSALIGWNMSCWWIWSTTFDTHFPATDTDILLTANMKNLEKLLAGIQWKTASIVKSKCIISSVATVLALIKTPGSHFDKVCIIMMLNHEDNQQQWWGEC